MRRIPSQAFLVAAIVAACQGSEPTPPPVEPPPPPPPAPPAPVPFSVRLISGGGVTDTIDAPLSAPLIAEARRDDGELRVGVPIKFSLVENGTTASLPLRLSASSSSAGDTTLVVESDAQGRASVHVTYGQRAGTYRVVVSAPDAVRGDTTSFTVRPGAVTRLWIPGTRDTLVSIGRGFNPQAIAFDRVANEKPDAISATSESSPCRVEARRVVGVSVGRCTITVRAGTFTESIQLSSVPVGKMLAVVNGPNGYQDPRLVSFAFDGSDYRELARLTYVFPRDLKLVTRAPDGVRMTMHAGLGDYSSYVTIFDSAGAPRELQPSGVTTLYENWGRFSRDGQWVYYSARANWGEAFSVWRARADGSGAERLTPVGANRGFHSNYADISADGRTLAFVDDRLYLSVMDLATRTTRTFMGDGRQLQSYQLRISPNGQRIAYYFDLPDGPSIRVINVDGTGYRVLPTPIGHVSEIPIDWTADGEWILTRRVGVVNGVISWLPWALVNATTGEAVPLPYNVSASDMSIEPVRP